jgi:hypothetical protein
MADNNDTSILPLIETPSAEQKRATSWGRGSYGANAFGGASSDTPGKRTRAALTVNHDDDDPVLNTIKQTGSKVANGQTREYTKEQKVPTTHGMRNRSGEQ